MLTTKYKYKKKIKIKIQDIKIKIVWEDSFNAIHDNSIWARTIFNNEDEVEVTPEIENEPNKVYGDHYL